LLRRSQVARGRLRYAANDEAIAQTAAVSAPIGKKTGWLIVLIVFGLVWFELINQLKAEWCLIRSTIMA